MKYGVVVWTFAFVLLCSFAFAGDIIDVYTTCYNETCTDEDFRVWVANDSLLNTSNTAELQLLDGVGVGIPFQWNNDTLRDFFFTKLNITANGSTHTLTTDSGSEHNVSTLFPADTTPTMSVTTNVRHMQYGSTWEYSWNGCLFGDCAEFTVSTVQSKWGNASIRANRVGLGDDQIYLNFSDATGWFSIWFYDDLDATARWWIAIDDADAGSDLYPCGVRGNNAPCVAANYCYYDGGAYVDSGIVRTAGWHECKIYNNGVTSQSWIDDVAALPADADVANVDEFLLHTETDVSTVYYDEFMYSPDVFSTSSPYSNYTLVLSVVSTDTINLTNIEPDDNENFDALPIFFNLTANFTYETNCSLYINDTVNQSNNGYVSGVDQSIEFNVTEMAEGFYFFNIGCSDNVSGTNTSARDFLYDITDPDIVTDFTNLTMYYANNITAQINVTDNLYVFSVNISIDDTIIYNESNVSGTFFQYNLSNDTTPFATGPHYLTIIAADGHTAKKLSSDFNPKEGKDLVYDIKGKYKDAYIKIYEKRNRKGDSWDTIKKSDRYEEVYVPSVPKSTMTFVVESDQEVYFASAGEAYSGGWLIIGDQWKDFVLKDEPNAILSFHQKNKRKYEVTVSGLKHPERLHFSSTGDLNINVVNYTFYVVNLTETFDYSIFSGFSTSWYLDVDLGGIADFALYNPNAIFQFDGVNYSATRDAYDANAINFSVTQTLGYTPFGTELVWHNWFFNMTPLTPVIYNTTNQTQNQTNVTVGVCSSILNHSILNITYYDEVNNNLLTVDSNVYALVITDGTYYYDQSGIFTNENRSSFCTNVDPANATYNWNAYGTFTLENSGYVTRVYTIDELSPTLLSNNPTTLLDLFMIGVNDSSTVTFSWLTTNFQQFDGTMKIYKCENDSTRSLVDSQLIINGLAFANLELFFTAYSYEVIIEGTTYTGAWTDCHIEAATEREFLVDLDEITILPVIGLFLVDCHMTNVSNDVTMTWGANPEDTTSIEACIIGKRQSIYNMTEVYRNCSNQTSGSFMVTVPNLANAYTVTGEITQNGVKGYCQDTLQFNHDRTDVSSALGAMGLLCIVILILSLALMYSGSGEKQVIAACVGVIIAFFIGLTSLPWHVISSICFLGVIVVLIGRYTKRGSVF